MSRRQVGINKPGKKSSSFFMFCGGGGACDLNSFSSCFTFHVGNRVLGEDGRGKRGKSPQGDLATSGMRKRERISLSLDRVWESVFIKVSTRRDRISADKTAARFSRRAKRRHFFREVQRARDRKIKEIRLISLLPFSAMKQRKGLLLEQWPGMVFGPPSGTEMRFGRCQNWGVAIRDFRDTGWLFVAIYRAL